MSCTHLLHQRITPIVCNLRADRDHRERKCAMRQLCECRLGGTVVLLGISLLLSSCASPLNARVAPTSTATATPGLEPTPLTGLLDPAPTNCQQTPPPDTRLFGPLDGFQGQLSVQGGGPVWMTSELYDLHLNAPGFTPLPSTKMLWAIGPNNDQPITIRGSDLLSGTPMFVDRYDGLAPATVSLFPPGLGNRGGGTTPDGNRWAIWGTGLVFVKAGCYRLTASWPDGSWETTFAVGR
jgi:hypothetical protein